MYSSAFANGEDGVIRDESLCRGDSARRGYAAENAENRPPESADGLKRGCSFESAEDLLLAAIALLLLLEGERGGKPAALVLIFLLFL